MRRSQVRVAPANLDTPNNVVRSRAPLTDDYVLEALGSGGHLACALPGYEARAGQIAMSRAVHAALHDRAHLLAEAPCGVGKGIAYLVPAIRHAIERGEKVVVATANINLQEQLCVGPSELVLTADLLHVPAEEVRAGMRLVAFDEERDGERRRMRESVVLAAESLFKPAYRLTFDDGSTVVCSHDHLWLCARGDTVQWLSAARMAPASGKRKGSSVVRVSDVWEPDRSYEAGYMAAAVDGEGWLSQKRSKQYNGFTTKLGFSQNVNAMLAEMRRLLGETGLNFSEKRHGSDHCRRFEVYERGSVLKFLGKYRPKRLLALFNADLLGTLPTVRRARLVSKVDLGMHRVVAITTSTRTLIVNGLASHNCNKDLPLLREVLTSPFTYAIAKGRQNYLCRQQLDEDDGRCRDARWREVLTWAAATRAGDVSELSFESGALRGRFTVSSDDCLGRVCPHYEGCFAERAKAEYMAADIVVTNYHMLLLDLVVRGANPDAGVLPNWTVLVADEGHRLPDIARDLLGYSLSRGMVDRVAAACAHDAPELTDDLRAEADDYFGRLLAHRRSNDYQVRLRRPGEVGGDALAGLLREAAVALEREAEVAEEGKRRKRLRLMVERSNTLASYVNRASELFDPERFVYCVEVDEERDRAELDCKLLWPADELRDKLFTAGRSVVVTSATLAVDGSFDFAARELGAERARTLAVPSPFDFERQCVLVIPRNCPDPKRRNDHEQWVSEQLLEVVSLAHGRTLGLFTSVRGMRKAAELLARFAGARDRTWGRVLVQGEAPRAQLVAQFKAEVGSVLLGVESFWEGVDVPGEALSVVVIDRIPFGVPDDPVRDAVDAALPNGAFNGWDLPRAVTAMRQGIGRLIRSQGDRGAVVVLDDRLLTKGYGKRFLRSFPAMRISRDLDDVARILDVDPAPEGQPCARAS